jgi:hypothetical protein
MTGKPARPLEIGVFWRSLRVIELFWVLVLTATSAMAPASGWAQTNIDQGKSAAEIFANDCAVCHKTPRGLAKGQNSLTLSTFLREHYTASRDQAASLAAYVMGAGGTSGTPAPVNLQQKPGSEPKTEPKTDAKTERPGAAKPVRPGEKPAVASRGPKQEPETPPAAQEPPAVVAAPAEEPAANAPAASPDAASSTSAAAPEEQPGENAPVPRDNIPD